MPFPRIFMTLCIAATLGLYGVMSLWGLPRLLQDAQGLPPFDVRIFGYSGEEARTYLAALSGEGRAFYLDVIGRLDGVFPPLLALSLILCFVRLAPRGLAALLSAVAIAAAVLDLLENAAISRMLQTDVANVTDAMVTHVSRLTQMKWAADGLSLAALMLLLGLAVRRKLVQKI